MLILLWFKGLFQGGRERLVGATLGVALCVALLALLGTFIVSSGATMTVRAITDVPVDWQVQLNTGTDAAAARTALGQATTYTALQTVDYATVSGLTVTSGTTTQTTGAGKVLGIDTQYPATFPGEIRLLTGTLNGALIAQQTAANLHADVGDRVAIGRLGLPPASITISGGVICRTQTRCFRQRECSRMPRPRPRPIMSCSSRRRNGTCSSIHKEVAAPIPCKRSSMYVSRMISLPIPPPRTSRCNNKHETSRPESREAAS